MPLASADVLVIDDDPFMTNLIGNVLADHGGFAVVRCHSAEEALQAIDEKQFRLIIVDIKMDPGRVFDLLDSAGGHKTGLLLVREIRKRLPETKIIIYTGAADFDVESWFAGQPGIAVLHKSPNPRPLLHAAQQFLEPGKRRPIPFIAHGRDPVALAALKDLLQSRLGFGKPMVLAELPAAGRTLIEKFERYAEQADVVFVLMTPDDTGHLAGNADAAQARARQNVIFELGYFLGYLRRASGRVVLLRSGPVELPSDLAGLMPIDISGGVEAAAEAIRAELESTLKTSQA